MIVIALALVFQPMEHQKLSWPVRGDVTSEFGERWGLAHQGVDISAEVGTWVRSAEDGLVVFAGAYKSYGNLVAVRHHGNRKTYYAHLQNYCVFQWQRIKRGQRVGRVGLTGRTTGPHLHFEVRVNRIAVDPAPLLPNYTSTGTGLAIGGP